MFGCDDMVGTVQTVPRNDMRYVVHDPTIPHEWKVRAKRMWDHTADKLWDISEDDDKERFNAVMETYCCLIEMLGGINGLPPPWPVGHPRHP